MSGSKELQRPLACGLKQFLVFWWMAAAGGVGYLGGEGLGVELLWMAAPSRLLMCCQLRPNVLVMALVW